MAGADGPATIRREPDRGSAIASTIARARDDDVLLIAGKGHETAQDVAGTLVAFDDRVVARAALETRRRSC
jgi:UDP-N-acetylmuramoyl-L-alanyl-D-glutamate--2,6-diaminopimelate ligase